MSTQEAGVREELLPCPFCGKPPHVEMTGFHLNGRTIRCETDDCMGPHTTAACEDDATIQWNTRAASPAAPSVPALFGTGDVREDFRAILELINPLHGEIDRQVMDQREFKGSEMDTPDDAEYSVNITAKHERDLTQAVLLLESRLAAPSVGVEVREDLSAEDLARAMQSANALAQLRRISWESIDDAERQHWLFLADAGLLAIRAKAPPAPDGDWGGVEHFDRAWDAILQCAELERARSRLSIHELRLIIRAAITGKTDK
jgi:hypothetical protein